MMDCHVLCRMLILCISMPAIKGHVIIRDHPSTRSPVTSSKPHEPYPGCFDRLEDKRVTCADLYNLNFCELEPVFMEEVCCKTCTVGPITSSKTAPIPKMTHDQNHCSDKWDTAICLKLAPYCDGVRTRTLMQYECCHTCRVYPGPPGNKKLPPP